MNLNSYSAADKIILGSAAVALLSMLLPWVQIGAISANGFVKGTFLLLVFLIYPAWLVYNKKPFNVTRAYLSVGVGMLLAIIFIVTMDVKLFGKTINAAGSGSYLFCLALAAMGLGIKKSSKAES